MKKITELYKARNILALVKSHKKTCIANCEISVFLLLEDFEKHMGRRANQKEIGEFL